MNDLTKREYIEIWQAFELESRQSRLRFDQIWEGTMKVQTAMTFAAALATVLMVPAAFGQQSTFRGPAGNQATPVPSSPVLPMANPVAPMSNPVSPAIASPYIRYGGTTPTQPAGRGNDNRPNNNGNNNNGGGQRGGGNGRGGRDVVYVPVYVPSPDYYYPGVYNQPTQPSVTIPGQLPGVPYQYNNANNNSVGSFYPTAEKPAATPPTSSFYYIPQPDPDEPRIIVNEPVFNRPQVKPPAVGTTRADVIARYGKPWGQFSSRGIETLYFEGLTVVFGPDGRVTSTR
jgi:hypothetical protein